MAIIANICVSPEATLYQVLEAINNDYRHFVCVVSHDNILLGTITDGDFRRSIINGQTLDDKASSCMNKDYLFATPNLSHNEAAHYMMAHKIRHLPILDSSKKIVGLHFLDDKDILCLPNSALIMAGGLGKRLRPLTNDIPKPMLEVGGKPMLETQIEQCKKYGIRRIYISVNYLKEKIIAYFGDGHNWGVQIIYLVEDQPLGTAGALHSIPATETHPILLLNGDILTKLDYSSLLDKHVNSQAQLTVCGRNEEFDIPYGVLNTKSDNDMTLLSVLEKPSVPFLVNAGIYVLDTSLVKLLKPQERIDMPELITRAITQSFNVQVAPIADFWIDVGRHETLHQAHAEW